MPEPALLLWSAVGACAALMCVVIVVHAWVSTARRRRRRAEEDALRPLLLAVLGGHTTTACVAACRQAPHAAIALLARHLWLVAGAWQQRLRGLLSVPEMLALLRDHARRPETGSGGLALQLLGEAQRAEDLPRLAALSAGRSTATDAAAVGLARGWRLGRPEALAALVALEERRPDLLRALLPHLDRDDLAHWLAGPDVGAAQLPLALFVAGRLDLVAPPTRIIAGCRHARAQVRRAACLATRHRGQEECLS